MVILKAHYGIEPLSFHYEGRSEISQSSYELGTLGIKYRQYLLTRRVHRKHRFKMYLYQSYNTGHRMATVTCPSLQTLSIYFLNRVYFITFLSSVAVHGNVCGLS